MAKKPTKKVNIEIPTASILDRMESEVQANQSRVSLVLGALIVLVVGILVFNYFSKNKSAEVTPTASQTENTGDATPENLPGKYTVKEGDTLFTIAEKYYKDGYKYTELVKVNSLTSADTIAAGQVLDIPKLETNEVKAAEISPSPISTPSEIPAANTDKGQTSDQSWGPAITENTYTVAEGDWLSTIAARAYNGDVMAYEKIAKANNITNPDVIEVGMVLTIPR